MSEQKKMKDIIKHLEQVKNKEKNQPIGLESDPSIEQNREEKSLFRKKNLESQNELEKLKNIKQNTKPIQNKDWSKDILKFTKSKKVQMMSKHGHPHEISPLHNHLLRSESLRIAQEKIIDLEEHIYKLREKNESLVSAGNILKDQNETLKSELKSLTNRIDENQNNFKDEKDILISALEEAKNQIHQLKSKNTDLEKRLVQDLHGVRSRENSLESRIEILKMENSVLQREKDNKIIELKKQNQRIQTNLNKAYKNHQELEKENNKLQEKNRRTISVLRATIHNIEGLNVTNGKITFTETD